MGLFSLDIGLDENSLDLGYIRESFDLVVGDGSHQSSLTAIVGPEETVVASTKKLHLGVVEKNLGTVRQCEGTVTQFLGIVVFIIIVGDFHVLLTFDTNLFDDLFVGVLVEIDSGVRREILGPLQIFHVLQVHQSGGDGAEELDDGQFFALGILHSELVLEKLFDLADISTNCGVLLGQSLEAVQLSDGSLGNGSSLGVGNRFGVGLQCRQQEGQERSGIERVVDELGHVVDNYGGLTLRGGGLFTQSSQQQRNNHGQGGRFDGLDKSDSGHGVHDFGNFLGLGDGGQNLSGHVFDITVSNNIEGALHGLGGSLLHLLLGVPHASSNFGDDEGKRVGQLLGGGVLEDCEALESALTGLPLLFNRQAREDGWKECLDGERSGVLADGKRGFLSSSADILALGKGLLQTSSQALLHEGLSGGNRFRQLFDNFQGGQGLGFGLRSASGH
mmetsp:Transcript_15332/g.42541  ORF Transcript_15332/g.42541 Transcript_15332/m.42541 type:complete len:446 (-) Transcript_15332:206-1543(-)